MEGILVLTSNSKWGKDKWLLSILYYLYLRERGYLKNLFNFVYKPFVS